MTMTNTITVPGRVVPAQPHLKAAGVTLFTQGQMAKVKTKAGQVLLRGVKIIVRPSGRKCHLARYLVGRSEDGVWWEIFLGVVEGLRGMFFQAKKIIQKGFLKLSALGLNPRQRLAIIG